MKINHQVNVIAITAFTRVNHHTAKPLTEYFAAVTMQTDDGQTFITFTRESSAFVRAVSVGNRFRLGGKFKREQSYNGHYGIVVTNATVNKVAKPIVVSKRTLRVRQALGI